MRKLVLVLLVVLAVSASAQTLDKPTRVSLFVSNFAVGWTDGGGFLDAGFGVALERRFTSRWSAELAAASEKHEVQPSFFNPAVYELRTYPVDAAVRFSFLDASAPWRPYVGAGARYVAAPDEPVAFVDYENQLTPQIVAGVEFNGGQSWSLHAGARQLIREFEADFDESFKISVGVGWRF